MSGNFIQRQDIAYQLVMIDSIVQGSIQNDRVEYYVSKFLESMRYSQMYHNDELWFLEPDQETVWYNAFSKAHYAAVLCGCEDELTAHVSQLVEQLRRKKLNEIRSLHEKCKKEAEELWQLRLYHAGMLFKRSL